MITTDIWKHICSWKVHSKIIDFKLSLKILLISDFQLLFALFLVDDWPSTQQGDNKNCFRQ